MREAGRVGASGAVLGAVREAADVPSGGARSAAEEAVAGRAAAVVLTAI